MNYSRHGSVATSKLDDTLETDSTCSLNSLNEDPAPSDPMQNSMCFGELALDVDRHISTQRPARDSVLRAVRGENESMDDFGESFAIDENDFHASILEQRRTTSNLIAVPDVSEEDDTEKDEMDAMVTETNAITLQEA